VADHEQTRRFLVLHDYGMGGLWWWITASSAQEITSVFADVEIIDDPELIDRVATWDLQELTMPEAMAGPLASFYETRQRQRQDPAFGRLLGQEPVYLKLPDPHVDGRVWYSEHDRTGRRTRQVQVEPDGTMVPTTQDDWPLNPPYDLGEPKTAAGEISAEDFETTWRQATRPF
jgi:hypothetical protein